jgi:predicted GIY-YIG superfamily endonuclease
MKIESFFPFKDKTKQVLDRSSVVYHIPCANCEMTYIGKTERILRQRIDEHKESKDSACFKHEKATGHKMAFSLVSVLDTADSDTKLKVKELLHILEKKPKLNEQLGSQSKYEINTLIVTKYTQFRADKR